MAKVKKAVVAAGGWGTRFFPAVKSSAKQMVPILDKPVIHLVLEELVGAGIEEVLVIHRHGDASLRRYFQKDPLLRAYLKKAGKEECLGDFDRLLASLKVLRFLPQPRRLPYGNASPVLAAKSFLQQEPFVYVFADDVTLEKKPGTYLRFLLEKFERYQPAIVLAAEQLPWSEIHTCASIKYKEGGSIPQQAEAVLEKLPADKAPSNWAQMGRFVCDARKVFAVLARQKVSRGNELWFADTVNTLAQEDVVIAAQIPATKGRRMTTGDPLNWLKANIKFALQDSRFKKDLKQFLKEFN